MRCGQWSGRGFGDANLLAGCDSARGILSVMRPTHPSLPMIATVVAGLIGRAAFANDESVFEAPVWLKAYGQVIDTGKAGGHSSPAVTDLNGDGHVQTPTLFDFTRNRPSVELLTNEQ